MADLKVRWRGVVYEIPTCMSAERAAVAASEWPDGVVDIATMMAPEHASDFSEHQRRQLAHMVLESLGESTLSLSVPTPASLAGVSKPIPAGFGTIGKSVVSRPVQRRTIDHAFLQELAASSSKTRGRQPGAAIRVVGELEAPPGPSAAHDAARRELTEAVHSDERARAIVDSAVSTAVAAALAAQPPALDIKAIVDSAVSTAVAAALAAVQPPTAASAEIGPTEGAPALDAAAPPTSTHVPSSGGTDGGVS